MRHVWGFLSVANVWSCGVAMAQQEWLAAGISTFFAVAAWWARGGGLASRPVAGEDRGHGT